MPTSGTDYKQNILDTIDQHRWFCTAVFDPEGASSGFAYTVGFTQTLEQAEFIIFGLPGKVSTPSCGTCSAP